MQRDVQTALDAALAYFRPSVHSRDDASISLTVGKMREHLAVIEAELALRANTDPSLERVEASTVTMSAAEHRSLLIRAGEFPAGVFVRAASINDGLHPSEANVSVQTQDGIAWCTMGRRSIINGCISVGWPISEKSGFRLVEFPRECDDGSWRKWVPESDVVQDPLPVPNEGAERC